MLAVVLMLAWAFPLAAIQLVPTARLANLATAQHEFAYLSAFASPPFHLVNYVAPGLFHRSPLWRPLIWDLFHAMPEEHLPYVGLIPLFLACMTVVRELRRHSNVRLLVFLSIVTLLLSLGLYVPGFRLLIQLPGFSFFGCRRAVGSGNHASARVARGKGFDRWREWALPRPVAQTAVLSAVCWVVATLGIIELAPACTDKPGWPAVSRGFQSIFASLPWKGEPSFETVLGQARCALPDPRVPAGVSDAIVLRKSRYERIFLDQRARIYFRELGETAVLVLLIFLTAQVIEKGWSTTRTQQRMLLFLTVLDLWVLSRHRLIDVCALETACRAEPGACEPGTRAAGTRIADRRLRNMPMTAGLAPIAAYRTLDLPAAVGFADFELATPAR